MSGPTTPADLAASTFAACVLKNVERFGEILGFEWQRARIEVTAPRSRKSLVAGGSIAVDGVCLTATVLGDDFFTADVVPETLRCTRLGDLSVGDALNLELPLRPTDRLGGHADAVVHASLVRVDVAHAGHRQAGDGPGMTHQFRGVCQLW